MEWAKINRTVFADIRDWELGANLKPCSPTPLYAAFFPAVRTVTENSRILKFTRQGCEAE
jgi:hypothetical protein